MRHRAGGAVSRARSWRRILRHRARRRSILRRCPAVPADARRCTRCMLRRKQNRGTIIGSDESAAAPVLRSTASRAMAAISPQRLGRAAGRRDVAASGPAAPQGGIGAYIGYSPYCVPRVVDGVKCVIVSEALQRRRADGLGLRDELRPRQRADGGRGRVGAGGDLTIGGRQCNKGLRSAGPASVARGPLRRGAQAASALTLADRRLLWRAALFLWKMPLSATESITLWACLNSSAALALSPATTAFCTFLIDGAEVRAQRGVGGVQLHVLARALAARGEADGLLLGFGRGGHAADCVYLRSVRLEVQRPSSIAWAHASAQAAPGRPGYNARSADEPAQVRLHRLRCSRWPRASPGWCASSWWPPTFGASAATDAFNVAFRIPNLFRRLFAEGAFSQAFVPVLAATRARDGDEATHRPDRRRGHACWPGRCWSSASWASSARRCWCG